MSEAAAREHILFVGNYECTHTMHLPLVIRDVLEIWGGGLKFIVMWLNVHRSK